MNGPYEISSVTPRLVVRRVNDDEVVSVCMVAPLLTKDEARQQAEHIVTALNSYDAACRALSSAKA